MQHQTQLLFYIFLQSEKQNKADYFPKQNSLDHYQQVIPTYIYIYLVIYQCDIVLKFMVVIKRRVNIEKYVPTIIYILHIQDQQRLEDHTRQANIPDN